MDDPAPWQPPLTSLRERLPELAGSGNRVDAFVERAERRRAVLGPEGVRDAESGVDEGARLQVHHPGGVDAVVTGDLTGPGLAAACAALRRFELGCPTPPLPERPASRPCAPVLPIEDALAHARELVAAARACPGVADAEVVYSDITRRIAQLTAQGALRHEVRTRCRLYLRVSVDEGAEGSDGAAAWSPAALRAATGIDGMVERAVGRARAAAAATDAPEGALPLVLAPSAGGVLVHELVAHLLETDVLAAGGTVLGERIGHPVSHPALHVLDDPLLEQGFGSYRFDDEGTPAAPTRLVTGGVLTGVLGTRALPRPGALSPGALPSGEDVETGANARRQSYAHPPLPRMSNIGVLAGTDSPPALLGEVADGLYCESLVRGQVDPVTGRFALGVDSARRIRRGRLDRPVGPLSITGNVLDTLAGIRGVGDDHDELEGVCGKDGQQVLVGMWSPTMLLAPVEVTRS